MKKFLAALMFVLLVSPVFADDAAPAAAAPAAAAPAADQAAPAAAAPKAKKTPSGDEAGIKKMFIEISDAWAAGDSTAVASHFLKEGSLITSGQEAWGRDDVEKLVASDLQTLKGSTQVFGDYKFHFVLPGCALVDLTGTVSGIKNADGTPAQDTLFHIYAAVALRGKNWFVLALRPYAAGKAVAASAAAAPAAAAPAAAPAEPAVPPAAAAAAPAAPAAAAPPASPDVAVPAAK